MKIRTCSICKQKYEKKQKRSRKIKQCDVCARFMRIKHQDLLDQYAFPLIEEVGLVRFAHACKLHRTTLVEFISNPKSVKRNQRHMVRHRVSVIRGIRRLMREKLEESATVLAVQEIAIGTCKSCNKSPAKFSTIKGFEAMLLCEKCENQLKGEKS